MQGRAPHTRFDSPTLNGSIFSFLNASVSNELPVDCFPRNPVEIWRYPLYIDVYQNWFSYAFDLGDHAFKIKGLCQDYFEDLLYIY